MVGRVDDGLGQARFRMIQINTLADGTRAALEALDFDDPDIHARFLEVVAACGAGSLLQSLRWEEITGGRPPAPACSRGPYVAFILLAHAPFPGAAVSCHSTVVMRDHSPSLGRRRHERSQAIGVIEDHRTPLATRGSARHDGTKADGRRMERAHACGCNRGSLDRSPAAHGASLWQTRSNRVIIAWRTVIFGEQERSRARLRDDAR
jgi:hypothetical protein